MPWFVRWSAVVATAVPICWVLWLMYLSIFDGLPERASFAGGVGSLTALGVIAGLALAKEWWWDRQKLWLPSVAMCVTMIVVFCAGSAFRLSPELSQMAFGSYYWLYEAGFFVSAPGALAAVVACWYRERRRSLDAVSRE